MMTAPKTLSWLLLSLLLLTNHHLFNACLPSEPELAGSPIQLSSSTSSERERLEVMTLFLSCKQQHQSHGEK